MNVGTEAAPEHYPVLLQEAIDAVVTNPDGVYVDGTFGRGGHSRALLAQLSDGGRLIGFDKDPEAVRVGQMLADEDKRFSIYHGSFAELAQALPEHMGKLQGVLLDLGVSSPQLDDADRGFSFQQDGPLDMRMNNSAGQSAAEWLASAAEADIATVLKEYGEERFGKRIAHSIVEARQHTPIQSTLQLARLVSSAVPVVDKHKHPATRTFQGIRIFINRELEDLQVVLQAALKGLKPGGRLAVISFHSLEDRMVKRFMQHQAKGDAPKGLPLRDDQIKRSLAIVGKAQKASSRELAENVRSRSAVMRVAEKLSGAATEEIPGGLTQ